MTFSDFSKQLSKIEATPKRLVMTSLLSELLKQADTQEVDKVVMLALGRLAPLYKDIDFGLAEKTVIRAIALANGIDNKEVVSGFKKSGDLGETTMALINFAKITKKSEKREPSVTEIFEKLMEIAEESGEGSQEKKINKTADLLRELDPLGAKYAVRIILGNLRLGFSDKTVLDALSVMIAGDKSAREKLEAAYNVRPDVGWLAQQVKRKGSEMLEWKERGKGKSLSISVTPQLGVPILPALCQRLPAAEEIITKMKKVAVEPKWDGQRLQAHLRLKANSEFRIQNSELAEVHLFTRSLEDVTDMFPDLVNGLRALIQYSEFPGLASARPRAGRIQNCILDGEAVAIDPGTGRVLPFQTMITRKRKYGIAEKLADVPVKYMIFDILYLNGKSLINEKFSNRRKLLEKILGRMDPDIRYRMSDSRTAGDSDSPKSEIRNPTIRIAPQLVTSDPSEIREFLKKQLESGLEGIVAKRSDAAYIPGRTQFAWVKLKWEGSAKSGGLLDTVDCVVMGTYAGRGKRAGFGVGAFLVGIAAQEKSDIRNHKSYFQTIYKTISKIGTGLTDEQWRELKVEGRRLKAEGKPKEYDVPKELTPDIWLKPKLVVEIQADNITKSPLHTAGYALRFPRLVRYRTDKRADQATTVEEVKRLYKMSLEH